MQNKVYFHSPFSEESVLQTEDRSLLLSFALSELFACRNSSADTWFLAQNTLSYSIKEISHSAPLNKLQEHSHLLLFAFPDQKEIIIQFREVLAFLIYKLSLNLKKTPLSTLKKLFSLLEPLMSECQHNENFLFFLLKHQKEIALLSPPSFLLLFLQTLHPKGLDSLQTLISDFFHKKGFSYLIPEVKHFIQKIEIS